MADAAAASIISHWRSRFTGRLITKTLTMMDVAGFGTE
jgi:hypothetical protein